MIIDGDVCKVAPDNPAPLLVVYPVASFLNALVVFLLVGELLRQGKVALLVIVGVDNPHKTGARQGKALSRSLLNRGRVATPWWSC